jgi:hypothetical protein
MEIAALLRTKVLLRDVQYPRSVSSYSASTSNASTPAPA